MCCVNLAIVLNWFFDYRLFTLHFRTASHLPNGNAWSRFNIFALQIEHYINIKYVMFEEFNDINY